LLGLEEFDDGIGLEGTPSGKQLISGVYPGPSAACFVAAQLVCDGSETQSMMTMSSRLLSAAMSGCEAGAQLACNLQAFARRHAVHVLHGNERVPISFADVVYAAAVRMRDLARSAEFVVDAIEEAFVARGVLGEELQSDRLPERDVCCAIHPQGIGLLLR
jgi:hypothetical protein